MNKLTATQSITLQAPLPKVWKYLTDPKLIAQYFFGTETITDWKVGSPILFRGEWEGKSYEDKGIILDIEKERLIRYSYWSSWSGLPDVPENYNDITYLIREESGQTIFKIIQEGVRDEDTKLHSEQNWLAIMQSLKKIIEE